MAHPTVSILLSVYNGQKTLALCLNSIANQTYQNIEIIGIDDASTDLSLTILQQWQKNHPGIPIIILHNQQNSGLTRSLMLGASKAQGTYIARLDADDTWTPSKLEKQVDYFKTHPDHGIVGCWYVNIHSNSRHTIRLPVFDTDIRKNIFWRNPFGHSCVLMRKDVFEKMGGYDTKLRYGQDRDLWFRFLQVTKLANIPEVLCYRSVDATLSTTKTRVQIIQQFKTVHKYIQLYKASPVAYLSFLEPLAVYMTPFWLRFYFRKIYDYFFAY